MSILQVITPSRIAGAERSTMSLCEHLQRRGLRVTIACKAGSALIGAMADVGLDVRPAAISGKANAAAPFRLARLARQEDARVIHSHLSTAAWHSAWASRLAGIPAVAHVRALNSPFCYRFARRVIAVSAAVREHLAARGIPRERIDVVYSGIDPDRYFLPCTREEARCRLGLPADAPLIGVVAHLTRKKGHHVFLPALAQVRSRHPRATALFLGEGEERERLEEQAAELGLEQAVRFAGFAPDVLPYYAAFDGVVLPSIAGEGLPRALLEAGLLGIPCVATQLSGAPEIVREGETGFLVPVGDAAALADRMDTLLADAALRARMGLAAREFVGSTFTVPAMIEGTLASYARAGVTLE